MLNSIRPIFCLCAALIAICVSTPSVGTLIYTDESVFIEAISPDYYLHDFAGQLGGDVGNTHLHLGPVNGFLWIAYAASGLYYVPDGLSVWNTQDYLILTFDQSPTPITSVGGVFFATDDPGNVIDAVIKVRLDDGSEETLSTSGFRGFTSDVPIVSLTVWAPNGVSPSHAEEYPALARLYVAAPERPTLLLLGLGVAALRVKSIAR